MGRLLYRITIVVLFLFLLAPVVLVLPMSFSADAFLVWPPSGFSTRWYIALARDTGLLQAARNSLVLALLVCLAALSLALPAALVLARGAFWGQAAIVALLSAPLLLPTIVLALALLIVFVGYGLLGSWPGLILAHLLVALPYAVRVLMTAVASLPPAVEEAASSLGAAPWSVFRRVTLPLMMPGVAAATAIVFLVSFDEVVISLFVVGPQLTTLPVALFHYVESRTDPLVAAVSALLVVLTLAIVLILERALGLARALGR